MVVWVDKCVRNAIREAANYYGGQSALARVSGVPQTTIANYFSGKVYRMNESIWEKLFPYCKQFIPAERIDRYDPEIIKDLPQRTPMNMDFANSSELTIPEAKRFKAVPIISIAQAAEYEPIEPLIDYLREVSDRAHHFLDVQDTHFAVEISGDSMSPDYPNGSIALVDSKDFPQNGDIVVAKFSTGQVVIKEYHRNDNTITLSSRNPAGQNYQWDIKQKPGMLQWIYPVIEIVLKPRQQRRK